LDEANLIDNPGRVGKILVDQMPELRITINGSKVWQDTLFDEYLFQSGVITKLEYHFGEKIIGSKNIFNSTQVFDIKKTCHISL
jgi:hypothetical protein